MNKYDAIIIGAGMSGLAAGIRLGMFDKKVLILERHSIAGGLNSYYQRKNSQLGGIRKFDVGLHALTNFIKKGEKNKPFSKLLKQLRLSYDDFKLCPQSYSEIIFPECTLKFSNDFELFKSEVFSKFPHEAEGFEKLLKYINEYNEVSLDNPNYLSAKENLRNFISDQQLIEMIISPLLIYGSAWEDDMDFSQFVIMFKSIYQEGFSRPEGGVRVIIDLLLNKLKDLGVELKFKRGVSKIEIQNNHVNKLILDNGEEVFADKIFSSIGLPETYNLIQKADIPQAFNFPRVGKMSFMESILVYDKKINPKDFGATIAFYNNRDTYRYRQSETLYDDQSAVFCIPDNYHQNITDGEGTIRITYMANYDLWKNLSKEEYIAQKNNVLKSSQELVKKLIPNFDGSLNFSDVFSPTTVEKFTWHAKGTVYGSIDKSRNGKTIFDNLFVIGTDQGFLGIIGAILSGISMANLYGLMEEAK